LPEHDKIEKAEKAARMNNIKRLYEINRLSERNLNTNTPVRDKKLPPVIQDKGVK
jgi:hypothetical protein